MRIQVESELEMATTEIEMLTKRIELGKCSEYCVRAFVLQHRRRNIEAQEKWCGPCNQAQIRGTSPPYYSPAPSRQ